MSNERKKVRATSQSSVSPPAAAPAAAPTLSSRRKALLLISGGMVLTGFVAWFFWSNPLASNRKDAAKLPDIPTAGLDATAATLIQQHLDAVGAAPRSASAWGKLGAVLKSFGFREQAIHCLAEAERLDPKEPRWPYLQAMLRSSEAAPAAIEKLRKAVRLCGNDPEMPRLRLARLLAETGKEDEAREQLRQLLGAKPNFGPARMLMAQIDQGNGKWDDAMRMAKGATTNVYTARAAWNLLSALHRRRGDTNAAEFASRRAAAVTKRCSQPERSRAELSDGRTRRRCRSARYSTGKGAS